MKKTNIFLIAILFLQLSAFGQKTYSAADFFKVDQIIWYGLDFTQARIIGNPAVRDRGYRTPQLIAKYFFTDWNSIPLAEASKYNIKGVFDKDQVLNDISAVSASNKTVTGDDLIDFNSNYQLDPSIIPGMIKNYGGLAKEGIGVAYIVEYMDHIKEVGSYYVVVFDIASKTVLFSANVKGKPAGANLKTYWAGAFRQSLGETAKLYKKWKKETIGAK